MNRFIFGFHRRVWWPKWTPASRSSRMETTAKALRPFRGWLCGTAGVARAEPELRASAPPPVLLAGTEDLDSASVAALPVENSLLNCLPRTWPQRTCPGTVPGQVRRGHDFHGRP